MTREIQDHINENCQYLSLEEILEMNEHDNGPINNVLTKLESRCFGIWLLDDGLDENYYLFYINGQNEFSGLIYKLNIHNPNRNELTFAFSKVINQEYSSETDLINIFNTFQHNTSTMLEKLNYFTYGNDIADKKATIIVKDKIGFSYVPTFDKIEAFQSIFSGIDLQNIETENRENWIYLMFNPKNGYTKIGRSINPSVREKTLQGEEPENQIIALWKANRTIELELHKKYESKRTRGEWFNLNVSDLIEIRKFMSELATGYNKS